MVGSDTHQPPRWEWRTFAPSLAWLEARIGQSARAEAYHSKEIYLLNSSTPHSAKIRGGALDVKRLEQIDPTGLELWRPALKAAFPLVASTLHEAFSALDLPPPAFQRDAYPLKLFLSDIIERDAAFQTVEVNKARRQFALGGCMAEFVRLGVEGVLQESFCIEHETAGLVLAALRRLELDSRTNVNFPQGLRRMLTRPR